MEQKKKRKEEEEKKRKKRKKINRKNKEKESSLLTTVNIQRQITLVTIDNGFCPTPTPCLMYLMDKWVTEKFLWTLTCDPLPSSPTAQWITSIRKIDIFVFPTCLPFLLSLHFLFVAWEIHLKSFLKLYYDTIYICYIVILLLNIKDIECFL